MDIKVTVNEAVKVLKSGGTLLFPTDTMWCVGCDATNSSAVEKLIKICPAPQQSLPVLLVKDIDTMFRVVKSVPDVAVQIIELSDKPVTIQCSGISGVARGITNSDGSAGIRIPNHDFCGFMLERLNKPVLTFWATDDLSNLPVNSFDVPESISSAVDFIISDEFDEGSTGKPESVIRLEAGGEVKIIRD